MRNVWWNQGIDGIDHAEHSGSRDDYVAWQRRRLLAMLAETDLHPGEYDVVVQKLQSGSAQRVMEAYPETHEVLAELRARGLRLAVCSNWDWDLAEALDEVGLGDSFDVGGVVGVGRSPQAAPAHLRGHPGEDRGGRRNASCSSATPGGPMSSVPDRSACAPSTSSATVIGRIPRRRADLSSEDVTLAPDLRTLLELVSTP